MSYANWDALVDKQTEIPQGNIMFNNLLIINGQIAGTWKRTIKRTSVQVASKLFRTLKEKERQSIYEVGQHYAYFLELTKSYTLNFSR